MEWRQVRLVAIAIIAILALLTLGSFPDVALANALAFVSIVVFLTTLFVYWEMHRVSGDSRYVSEDPEPRDRTTRRPD